VKYPQATRTSLRSATPLKGATPVAQQSRFHGVPRFGPSLQASQAKLNSVEQLI